MPNTKRLTGPQRDFFAAASKASFSNPFGQERLELDRQLSGEGAATAEAQITERALSRIRERVAELERKGAANLSHYGSKDAEVLRNAFLFDIFHRFVPQFDRHILQQLDNGDTPCPAPFAAEVLQAIHSRGFSEPEALRYLAFFFQLRRAFFFITQELTGNCASMRELRCRLWHNLFTHDIRWYEHHLWNRMEDFSTLILGETGTGKGTAAAAIGRSGHIPFDEARGRFAESFTRSFISRNLSQFPQTLIESELFGHKKGAFTGAISDYKGVFSLCSPHGAIFLDEIGDVSPPVQIKLLQILQERTFSPVGSHEAQRFKGRVIAATNQPIDRLRKEHEFRDDFFYRLCSDIITVPTLRQRLQENPGEMELLLEKVVEKTIGHADPALSAEIREILEREPGRSYHWPGNVRELEQATRRILLSGRFHGETPGAPADLSERLQAQISAGTMSAQELLQDYCALLYQRLGTYEQVARITGLDRRTVKKYLQARTTGTGQ